MHSTDKKTLLQYKELNTTYKDLQEKIKQNLLFKNGVLISVFSNKYIKYYHKNKDLVDKIVEITSFIERPDVTFQERVFCIFNNLYEVPKCKNCGGVTKFIKGYIEHCCRECKNEQQKGKYVGEKSCKRILSYSRVKEILGDNLLTKYDEYKGRLEDIEIICKVCEGKYLSAMVKEVFRKDPGHCPRCNTKMSLPVREICDYLKQNNIKYITEFRFKECINPETGYPLPFDIYLPEKDIIIEYDGPHHVLPVYGGGDEYLKSVAHRDRIKNEWCINNGKILLRIPHTVHNYISYTHSFLQNISPKYEIYSNNEYNNDIIELRDYIESFGYKDYIIFGIYRGSLQPAVHLSNITNARKNIGIIQFQSYDGNDRIAKILCEGGDIDKNTAIFVIDDIYDTGNTINKVKKKMKYKYKHNNIHYITLFGKPNNEGVYYVRENKNFVIFPWEIINDTRCKSCRHSEPCYKNPKNQSHCNIKDKSFPNNHTCEYFEEK